MQNVINCPKSVNIVQQQQGNCIEHPKQLHTWAFNVKLTLNSGVGSNGGLRAGLAVVQWWVTNLEHPGETMLFTPQPILEADFWLIFKSRVGCMKSGMNFIIIANRVGGRGFGSGSMSGDPTGTTMVIRTTNPMTNFESRSLVNS